ncbi:MAG TPA: hypothetical protein VGK47_04505 [Nitrososphaeraceae archaeon]
MIEQLTDEQKAKIPEYVEKWEKIFWSTERADKGKAEEGIREYYKQFGIEPPKHIIWFDSPYALCYAIEYSQSIDRIDRVEALVDQYPPQPNHPLGEISILGVGSIFEAISLTNVSIMRSVSKAVWNQISTKEFKEFTENNDNESTIVPTYFTNFRLNARLCAIYSYCREVLGLVEQTEKVKFILEIAQHCEGIAPFYDICFASDRPLSINDDNSWRNYNDGWSVCPDHGPSSPLKNIAQCCSTIEELEKRIEELEGMKDSKE